MRANQTHETRRGSPPPTPPILRASNLWSEEEDNVLIKRYREFRARGKLQGYSQYIAMCLPKKTDRQVRDRTRTLKEAGILVEPKKAEQQPPSPEPRETQAPEEPEYTEETPELTQKESPEPLLNMTIRSITLEPEPEGAMKPGQSVEPQLSGRPSRRQRLLKSKPPSRPPLSGPPPSETPPSGPPVSPPSGSPTSGSPEIPPSGPLHQRPLHKVPYQRPLHQGLIHLGPSTRAPSIRVPYIRTPFTSCCPLT
ncbi:proline-rich protein HaeIII subfamily 1-like [Homalodisca vitripennis]|uniref:proline-rich protein HaeIII subfamily 1-like n=1 Tax=Homalodisca vitripennis TaxID=197043 RepID=UPI001EEC904A|nr:proline-rich protein HaeIII subfamily 1-like [Homalodisca vitripennis]